MGSLFGTIREFFKNDDIVSALTGEPVEPPLSDPKRRRNTGISTTAGYLLLLAFIFFMSAVLPAPPEAARDPDLPDLIFVMQPGPGGGGGGGGDQSENPESVLKIEGEDRAKLAINVEKVEDELVFEDPDKPVEEEKEEEPEDEEVNAVEAPVVAQAPDDVTEKGTIEGTEQLFPSAGSGEGTGMGSGRGSGLGEGYGGGFGGGAYRMGSGITTPIVVRQVQPTFTDDALARKIEGEVIVEVVILKDGSVQPVRVLRGLSADLNQKALEAASKWKFIPGKFQGKPVDVIAEIIVSFNIL
jgi:TonB family protein